MMHEADLAHCREAIKHGSKSFYAASKLLPARVRDPALVDCGELGFNQIDGVVCHPAE